MKIFSNIPLDDGDTTIKNAFVAIVTVLEQKKRKGLILPCSLSELLPDNEDFQWLYLWAKNLGAYTASTWLSPGESFSFDKSHLPSQIAIGSLLMFLNSEVARREADEGHLWAFCCNRFSSATKNFLFSSNNQPTQLHKDALEKAARWLKLRHVFGVKGLQNWFDSIYLQFGFTCRGFHRRLPEWLAGYGRTQAIDHLLSSDKGSRSFKALWEALRNYRRNNIGQSSLYQILIDNPWVLPEWVEDLVSISKQRPELAELKKPLESETTDISFLSQPIFVWDPPNTPNFSTQISNIASLDLSEATYDLTIDGQAYARLIRQSDNTYHVFPSIDIEFPITCPTPLAQITNCNGQTIHSMPIDCWDSNEDITIYNLPSGQRLKDPWQEQMKQSSAYALLLASDLKIYPEPNYWQILGRNQLRLYFLSNNWPSTNVLLGDNIFWQPCLSNISNDQQYPWIRSITLELFSNKPIVLNITHPTDIEITFVRYNGLPINFKKVDDNNTLLEPISLSSTIGRQISLRLGLTNGVDITSIIKTTVGLDFFGVTQLTSNGWEIFERETKLTVEQAKSTQFKICPPKRWDKKKVDLKEWALMEGDIWLGRLQTHPAPIFSLAGIGNPLTLRSGPYNSLGDAITISESVIDPGLISEIEILPSVKSYEEKLLKLKLFHSIELDPNHHIVWWDMSGAIHNLPSEKIFVEEKTSWVLNFEQDFSKPIAIAIAYNGVRLGSWWSIEPDWTCLILEISEENSKLVAALIRWFHLPILSKLAIPAIQSLAKSYPKSILLAWLHNTGLPAFLSVPDLDDSWLAAVRILFQSYMPRKNDGKEIVEAFSNYDESNTESSFLVEALQKFIFLFMRVDPLLMGKIIIAWLNDFYFPKFGKLGTKNMLQKIYFNIAELEDLSERGFRTKQKSILQEISETMKLDPNFIQIGLINRAIDSFMGKHLQPFDEANIALATSVEPFRRLLTIQILENIANRK